MSHTKILLCVIMLSVLGGCYETAYTYRERQKLEERVKELERQRDREGTS